MEERYEIREKIGHGGLGAVYRAFDRRMNREVALKRILGSGDAASQEATQQLMEEAGALAALQHPHIVTVYDVGIDQEGPFVVMELITGKTLDDLVETATLTWQDFHELALQTQEALIGAQELKLVHRDIKPSNVMLNWLPSGKFQVKIVDFGLAKFTPKPTLQEVGEDDSVLGSIFFMAPEQFERLPLDARVDMYSMGCLYYYALTGLHPFNGETGQEVMDAHLQHRIFPLREMRPDIPRWAVDWVMWHMNRLPEHRPQSAREALQVFLLNDRLASTEPEEEEEQNKPFVPPKLTRPKRPSDSPPIGEDQSPPVTVPLVKTAPQPILPPSGTPSLHGDGPLTSSLGIIGSPLTATQAHQLAETLAPPLDRKITDATSAQRRMHITGAQTVRETVQPARVVPEQSPSGQLVPTGHAHVSKPVVPLHAAQQHALSLEILARKKLQQKKKRAMIGLGAGLLLLVIVLVLVLISSGKR